MSCRAIIRGNVYDYNINLPFCCVLLFRYLASNNDPEILLQISKDVSILHPFRNLNRHILKVEFSVSILWECVLIWRRIVRMSHPSCFSWLSTD